MVLAQKPYFEALYALDNLQRNGYVPNLINEECVLEKKSLAQSSTCRKQNMAYHDHYKRFLTNRVLIV